MTLAVLLHSHSSLAVAMSSQRSCGQPLKNVGNVWLSTKHVIYQHIFWCFFKYKFESYNYNQSISEDLFLNDKILSQSRYVSHN